MQLAEILELNLYKTICLGTLYTNQRATAQTTWKMLSTPKTPSSSVCMETPQLCLQEEGILTSLGI